MEHQAARADALMRKGLELLPLLDRRSALCVRSFAGIYRGLLVQMRARGYDVFSEPPRLSAVEKMKAVVAAVRVAVVGGGLAGLAAALELTKQGHDVRLFEARPTLGGAVQTLPEREGDPSPPPDNGQHVALGCCTAYLDFVAEIGQAASLRRVRLGLPVVAEDGSVATIRPGLVGLLRYGHIGLGERLATGRVARKLAKLDPAPSRRRDVRLAASDVRPVAGGRRPVLGRLHPPCAQPWDGRGERRAGHLHRADRAPRRRGSERPAAPDCAARRDARRRGRRRARPPRRGDLPRDAGRVPRRARRGWSRRRGTAVRERTASRRAGARARGLAHRQRPPSLRPADHALAARCAPGERRALALRPRCTHGPPARAGPVHHGGLEWSSRSCSSCAAGSSSSALQGRSPNGLGQPSSCGRG